MLFRRLTGNQYTASVPIVAQNFPLYFAKLPTISRQLPPRLDMTLERSRKEKGEDIEGAELQFTFYLLGLQSLSRKFWL